MNNSFSRANVWIMWFCPHWFLNQQTLLTLNNGGGAVLDLPVYGTNTAESSSYCHTNMLCSIWGFFSSENVNMICIVYGEQPQRKMKYIFLLSFLIMSVFVLHTRVTNESTISSADFPSSLCPLTANFLIDQQHQTAALLLPVPAASRAVRDAHHARSWRAVRHHRRGPFKFQLSETLVCHMDMI